MSESSDADVALKQRMMRLLWNLGYLPYMNVVMAEPWEKGLQYTDIDVLGIRVDEELSTSRIVCECKSGIKAKTRDRLFWLSGVMKYFEAERGLFVRTQLLGTRYMELAKTLNILTLSSEQLSELELAYDVSTNTVSGLYSANPGATKTFSLLGQFDRGLRTYVASSYWEDGPGQQIANLVVCCEKIAAMSQLSNKAKFFLLCHVLSLLSISVLRLSREILTIPDGLKPEAVRLGILGGRLKAEESSKLLGAFHAFMTKEIREKYNADYPLSSSQFIDNLTPVYSKYLIDLVVRICKNPRYSIMIPRFLQMCAYDVVLLDEFPGEEVLGSLLLGRPAGRILKPLIDFIAFAERSNLAPKALLSLLEDTASQVSGTPIAARIGSERNVKPEERTKQIDSRIS